MRHYRFAITTLLLALAGQPATADTLEMPEKAAEQGGKALTAIEMPSRGMSMRQVESRFGTPKMKVPAVGEPPISRWVYDDYTVYFEHRYVLHSVLNAPRGVPAAPTEEMDSER